MMLHVNSKRIVGGLGSRCLRLPTRADNPGGGYNRGGPVGNQNNQHRFQPQQNQQRNPQQNQQQGPPQQNPQRPPQQPPQSQQFYQNQQTQRSPSPPPQNFQSQQRPPLSQPPPPPRPLFSPPLNQTTRVQPPPLSFNQQRTGQQPLQQARPFTQNPQQQPQSSQQPQNRPPVVPPVQQSSPPPAQPQNAQGQQSKQYVSILEQLRQMRGPQNAIKPPDVTPGTQGPPLKVAPRAPPLPPPMGRPGTSQAAPASRPSAISSDKMNQIIATLKSNVAKQAPSHQGGQPQRTYGGPQQPQRSYGGPQRGDQQRAFGGPQQQQQPRRYDHQRPPQREKRSAQEGGGQQRDRQPQRDRNPQQDRQPKDRSQALDVRTPAEIRADNRSKIEAEKGKAEAYRLKFGPIAPGADGPNLSADALDSDKYEETLDQIRGYKKRDMKDMDRAEELESVLADEDVDVGLDVFNEYISADEVLGLDGDDNHEACPYERWEDVLAADVMFSEMPDDEPEEQDPFVKFSDSEDEELDVMPPMERLIDPVMEHTGMFKLLSTYASPHEWREIDFQIDLINKTYREAEQDYKWQYYFMASLYARGYIPKIVRWLRHAEKELAKVEKRDAKRRALSKKSLVKLQQLRAQSSTPTLPTPTPDYTIVPRLPNARTVQMTGVPQDYIHSIYEPDIFIPVSSDMPADRRAKLEEWWLAMSQNPSYSTRQKRIEGFKLAHKFTHARALRLDYVPPVRVGKRPVGGWNDPEIKIPTTKESMEEWLADGEGHRLLLSYAEAAGIELVND